jgi:hypothetical protein
MKIGALERRERVTHPVGRAHGEGVGEHRLAGRVVVALLDLAANETVVRVPAVLFVGIAKEVSAEAVSDEIRSEV